MKREAELKRRSDERRKRILANRAANFEEAEKWDLDFWQRQSPEMRLSALVAIRRDIQKVDARAQNECADDGRVMASGTIQDFEDILWLLRELP